MRQNLEEDLPVDLPVDLSVPEVTDIEVTATQVTDTQVTDTDTLVTVEETPSSASLDSVSSFASLVPSKLASITMESMNIASL